MCVIRLFHDAVLYSEVIQHESRKSGGKGGGWEREQNKAELKSTCFYDFDSNTTRYGR